MGPWALRSRGAGGGIYGHRDLVAFNADGLRYAVAREGRSQLDVLDVDTGAVVVRLLMEQRSLTCLAFSPDGPWLACGTREGAIDIWGAQNGQRIVSLPGHTAQVSAMAFSLDGRRLVTTGYDETLRRWELPSGAPLANRPLDTRAADVRVPGAVRLSGARAGVALRQPGSSLV